MTTTRRAVRLVATLVVAAGAVLVPLAQPAAAGGGCHLVLGGEAPTEATGTTVELEGMCMAPTVLRTEPGSDVTFVNRDEMVHNLYGVGLAVSELQLGQSASVHYDRPGVYPFACTLHVGMVGAVVVGAGAAEPTTTTTSAPVPLAATRPLPADDGGRTSTPLVVAAVVGLALALALAGTGHRFGRRSASLSAHDRADR